MSHLPLRLYLASQSPRRRELLKQLNVNFDMLPLRAAPGRADVEEIPLPEETASAFVERMAKEKARCGWKRVQERGLPRQPVLGADTDVELDGIILGKPASRRQAEEILGRLSGRDHWVHTAVAVMFNERLEFRLSSSKVIFAPLSAADIGAYLASGEALDKAGAYAIQGRAGRFVQRIEGSYSGIMGLPLYETAELLRLFGFSS